MVNLSYTEYVGCWGPNIISTPSCNFLLKCNVYKNESLQNNFIFLVLVLFYIDFPIFETASDRYSRLGLLSINSIKNYCICQ